MAATSSHELQRAITEFSALVDKNLLIFLKGFGSGIGIYTIAKLVKSLAKNPSRWRYLHITLCDNIKDCLRFGSFVGLYPCVYVTAKSLLEKTRLKKSGYSFAVAGGLAGLTILVEESSRRSMITMFTAARALGSLSSIFVSKKIIRPIPHLQTLIFCVVCSFITYCVTKRPDLLDRGYYKSVLSWSRTLDDSILGNLYRIPRTSFLSCSEAGWHHDSCGVYAMKYFVTSLPIFAKLYLFIHLAPVVLFKHRLIRERPKQVLMSLLRNVPRSTIFLTSMMTSSKYLLCLLRNWEHKAPPASGFGPAIGGFLCGLSILFERVSRRSEILLLCIQQCLHAIYNAIRAQIKLPVSLLFVLSTVVMMHSYEVEPHSLTRPVISVINYLVGSAR